MKNKIKKFFKKILKDSPSKLSAKAINRANKIDKLNAGTPHDWEDYARYIKEKNKHNQS